MSDLTINQRRRSEAVTAAARLLTEHTTDAGHLHTGGGEESYTGMLGSDAVAAITLADYIVRGLGAREGESVVVDEDGLRIAGSEDE